ncbi:hypothetical protein NDU88_005956 [Pleurodeles waltl]|uniref:Uncharacterized protein n=1 Tax=Pleurodeles waltl TaxID=8319 RepID=A0AAV7LMW1_PLEWA|nr:hypothetical protein NDU88_005956 [Pleurodeles waltl]
MSRAAGHWGHTLDRLLLHLNRSLDVVLLLRGRDHEAELDEPLRLEEVRAATVQIAWNKTLGTEYSSIRVVEYYANFSMHLT